MDVLNGVTVVTDVIGGVSGDLNQVCTCRKEGRERGHPPLIDTLLLPQSWLSRNILEIILRDNVGYLRRGGLAQLVERVLSMHEVVSSILTFSTFVSFLHLRLLAHRVVAWWPFTRQANIACIVLFYMYCISSVVAAC